MKENVKRVFHVRFLNHPCYAQILATRPEIRLDKLENDSPEGVMSATVTPIPFLDPKKEIPAKG